MTENERKAIKAAKAAYAKKWRDANPYKVKSTFDRYWLKKAAQMQLEQEATKDGKQ